MAIAVTVATGAMVAFHLVGGWYFANVLDQSALDATQRREELRPDYGVEVLALGNDTITIAAPATGDRRRPGTWGVAWPDGYGYADEIVAGDAESVTRAFRVVYDDGDPLAVGDRIEFQERAFPDRTEAVLGVTPTEVMVAGPLGDYPSWFVPGERSTWALLLHGNGLDRLDLAKLAPTLRAEGYPILFVAMRNDPGSPMDPSGRLRYGATEWADLEAAVLYATEQGASDVVLIGPSMGGGVALAFLERSPMAGEVRAVVLDAPMLDFERAVDFQAEQETLPVVGLPLPSTLTTVAKRIASQRFGVEWADSDHLRHLDRLAVPILVFHGTEDEDVPIGPSEELAAARPDLVTLREVSGAGHLSSWNVDPQAYESALVEFLDRHAPGS